MDKELKEKKAKDLTREECEKIFRRPVDDELWSWIVDNERQQEVLDSYGKER